MRVVVLKVPPTDKLELKLEFPETPIPPAEMVNPANRGEEVVNNG